MNSIVSIITITYNDLNGLINTSKSILPLPNNCEWIIIDGNSSDGTKKFLETLPVKDNIKYVSEKDNGIYDAMNKGILLAKGKYLSFMNSGDAYVRETFLDVVNKLTDDVDIVMYDCKTISQDGKDGYSRAFPKDIDEIRNWACIQHQSTLIKKDVFDKLGLYSLNYKYLSDYEHSVKAYLDDSITFRFDSSKKLAIFLLDGVSTNPNTSLIIANEYKKIQLRYFGKYNKKLFITNYVKYFIGFLPFKVFIIKILKRTFLTKR